MDLGGLLGGAASLIGIGAASKAGVGKNRFQAQNFGDSGQYNANAYQYGGHAGGANEAATRYANTSGVAQGRASGLMGDAYYQGLQNQQARGQQQDMAGLMAARARGQVPSIAQMQADRSMGQLASEQASAAASARGPAALAMAQQQAAANTATGMGNIAGQAQINAANERLAAENAAMGAYGQIRTGDQQGQLANYGAAAQQGQLGLGYNQLENQVRSQQLQAGGQQQGMLAASAAQANSINSGTAQNNANTDFNYLKMAMGAGQDALSSATKGGGGGAPAPPGKAAGGPVMGGQPYTMGELGPELVVPMGGAGLMGGGPGGAATFDSIRGGGMDVMDSLARHSNVGTQFVGNPMARADGGPVASGQPYLVGERGPEIVMPAQNGVVIPAHQTQGLLAMAEMQKRAANDQAGLAAGPYVKEPDSGPHAWLGREYGRSGPPAWLQREMADRERQDRLMAEADRKLMGMRMGLAAGPSVGRY